MDGLIMEFGRLSPTYIHSQSLFVKLFSQLVICIDSHVFTCHALFFHIEVTDNEQHRRENRHRAASEVENSSNRANEYEEPIRSGTILASGLCIHAPSSSYARAHGEIRCTRERGVVYRSSTSVSRREIGECENEVRQRQHLNAIIDDPSF